MIGMTEASFYRKAEENRVECLLCPQHCKLADGRTGLCMGRKNEGGTLFAINYGEVASIAMDPMEKKPLYHFLPGAQILSTGPNGCNLACEFCQNWEISQVKIPTRHVSPESLVRRAQDMDSAGIAYTYTEPLIWYEYVLDCAELCREKGMVNVLVTNGFINPEPLDELLPFVDAMNIDVKSMDEEFYRKVCRGKLADVLRTAERAKQSCHIEITNLVIPTLNDSDDHFSRLTDWVADTLGVDTPLHFSRYGPRHKMRIPPTPRESLERAYRIATQKLYYVFVGNIAIEGTSNTTCPQCRSTLVTREWYAANLAGIHDGRCASCGRPVDIVLEGSRGGQGESR
jgi:pyruvate formate lyase activating enzyme